MGVLDSPVVVPKDDLRVIFDTDFNNGPSGFTQLIDDTRPIGCLGLDTEFTYHTSRYSLLLSTEDYSWLSTKNWGMCTAIKRLGRGATIGRVKYDVWFAWASQVSENGYRRLAFGIDQADPAGARNYFSFEWINWDDEDPPVSAGSKQMKFRVLTDQSGIGLSTRRWVDVPGGGVKLGHNEHKRNLNHVEMVFDIGAKVYDGLRVNGTGLGGGSLSDGTGGPAPVNPSNPLRALGSPLNETLVSFASGFNFTLDMANRLNISNCKSWTHIGRARAEHVL